MLSYSRCIGEWRIGRISATFAITTYNVATNAGLHGSVDASSVDNSGRTASVIITPDACYHIADVLVNGVSVGAVSSYTFNNITGDSTISATFAIITYNVTTSAGPNGSIDASSVANCGSSATVNITPAACYHVADVLVNGVSVGAVNS